MATEQRCLRINIVSGPSRTQFDLTQPGALVRLDTDEVKTVFVMRRYIGDGSSLPRGGSECPIVTGPLYRRIGRKRGVQADVERYVVHGSLRFTPDGAFHSGTLRLEVITSAAG